MEPLSPLVALAGGALIGLAAALLLLLSGRIAGVSGMAARALGIADTGTPWPLAAAFIAPSRGVSNNPPVGQSGR